MTRLLIALAWFLATSCTAAAVDTPNVLFITSDDQRTDTIRALGNDRIHTPHLDALVESGTTFTNAYCMGSWSGAVCLPSRGMLMTGQSLYDIQPWRDVHASHDVPLMPELFRSAGYSTFATGKWHSGDVWFHRCFERGRSVLRGGMGSHFTLPVQDADDGAFGEKYSIPTYSSTTFADAAIDAIHASADDARPFFMHVSFTTPHDPRTPPDAYIDTYAPDDMMVPPNFLPLHPFHNGEMVVRDEELRAWPRTPQAVREEIAKYYALITHMDEQIGRMLAALEDTGQRDNTVIVFVSDHGLAVGSHGLLGKQNLYEHSMKAPMIAAGPGVPKNARIHTPVYLHEISGTMCALAGLPVPEEMTVLDLQAMATDPDADRDRVMLLSYQQKQRAVIQYPWKLIRYPKIDRTQLFNLEIDPHEITDLASHPSQARRIDSLLDIMAQAQADVGDQAPLHVDNPTDGRFDHETAEAARLKKNHWKRR